MPDVDTVSESLTRWWTSLGSDWQAVLLGLLALLAVSMGVQIPW